MRSTLLPLNVTESKRGVSGTALLPSITAGCQPSMLNHLLTQLPQLPATHGSIDDRRCLLTSLEGSPITK
eukprot:3220418-Amphidinium_carterae.1